MPWETLPRKHKPHVLPPSTVSFWCGGRLGVTPIAEELGAVVEVFYDPEENRLGLKPCSPDAADVFTVYKSPTQNSWSISMLGVVNSLKLDVMGKRYRVIREDSMFIIDLNNPIN